MIRLIILATTICLSTITHAKNTDDINIEIFRNYLEKLQSVAIDYEQIDSKGISAKGKLLINKPYRFRCNYYTPFPIIVIGNSGYVSVYDYEMEQVSRIKPEENIFNFLLSDNSTLEKGLRIESVSENNNIIHLTFYHNDLERRSIINFDKVKSMITSIETVDNEDTIRLIFYEIIEVASFDKDLFILQNPEIFGVPPRLSKEAIEAKYVVKNK